MRTTSAGHAFPGGALRLGRRLSRSLFALLFTNPYPLAAVVVLIYFVRCVLVGFRAHVHQTGFYPHDAVYCGLSTAVLGMLIAVALIHTVATVAAGWREADSSASTIVGLADNSSHQRKV